MYVTTQGNLYLDTTNTRMIIESSSKNFDLPVNIIRYSSPAGTRDDTIIKNTDFTLEDKYVVGENKLLVFVDDILCCIGTEYNEIGIKGEESNIIQFVDWDITPDMNLEYIIIGKDYLTISVNGEKVAKVNNNIDLSIPTKTSDLINNSGFITSNENIASADVAKKTQGNLQIIVNGETDEGTKVYSFDGSINTSAEINLPTQTTDLLDANLLVYSKDSTVKDIRIISQAAYDILDKSTIANNTVYLVYE